jgi:xylulose-5-phosphate/fructose-6-phosphate phosphoketolase
MSQSDTERSAAIEKANALRLSQAAASGPLPPVLLARMHRYWQAANYLSVGQIYLYDNPLLKEPLTLKHVKPRLLGHWGTTPD